MAHKFDPEFRADKKATDESLKQSLAKLDTIVTDINSATLKQATGAIKTIAQNLKKIIQYTLKTPET